jgi:pre-rRNA-processing protein IPI3
VEVKCFPEEPIKPLVANSEGTYLVGGGLSGNIYFWEVGFLLSLWFLISFESCLFVLTS